MAAVEQIKALDTTRARLALIKSITGTAPFSSDKREKVFKVREITPAQAEQLIALTGRQRPVKARHVHKLALAMKDGTYVWTPQNAMILFNKEGNLTDAQHRLHACVMSGVSLKDMDLRIVADDNAALHYDIGGIKRTVADHVSFATGIKLHGTTIAAIVYEACNFQHMSGIIQDTDRVAIVQDSVLLKAATDLQGWGHRLRLRSGFFAGALRCYRMNPERAGMFFSKVLNNDPMIEGTFSQAAKDLSNLLIDAMNTANAKNKGRGNDFDANQQRSAEATMRYFLRWMGIDNSSRKITYTGQVPRELAVAEMPALFTIPSIADRIADASV